MSARRHRTLLSPRFELSLSTAGFDEPPAIEIGGVVTKTRVVVEVHLFKR